MTETRTIARFQVAATLAADALLYLLLIAVRAAFAPFAWLDVWSCLFVFCLNVLCWAIIALREERWTIAAAAELSAIPAENKQADAQE